MRYLLLVLTLSLTINCVEKKSLTLQNNFNLVYEDNIDKVNISEGSLTRKFINGEKTIRFSLDKKEISELFDFIVKKKIETIELKDLNNNCSLRESLEVANRLEITLTKKMYVFEWTSNNCGERIDDLDEIVGQLKSILMKDNAVKQLEPTDIVFE